MNLKTLAKSKIKPGAKVLMRIDCDVPLKAGRIQKGSTWRLERAIPDICDLTSRGAIVILVGHLGRPNGKVVKNLSLAPISKWLASEKKIKNVFTGEVIGKKTTNIVNQAKPGSVVMLENVRFSDREEKDCKKFAHKLAALADIYVNNAFGTCHRKHSSVHRITELLPSYAGSVLVEEVGELSKKMPKPLTLLVGGAKLETKIPLIKVMAGKAQTVLIGGGLALVFHEAATGVPLKMKGKIIIAPEVKIAKNILKKFDNIKLPIDYVDSNGKKIHAADLNGAHSIVDIGLKTARDFADKLKKSKTVIFNGAMGIVEIAGGKEGTIITTRAFAGNKKVRSIVGGGDTVAFVQAEGIEKKFSFLSTGGGAMLAFLASEKLPGLEVLWKL